MQRDRDYKRPPGSDEPELIPTDPDARRSRMLRVKLVNNGAKRRQRFRRMDSFERQRLEDAAREIHGPVTVTPALPNQYAVGDMLTLGGRPWMVGAVCPCTPLGWSRLDPVRTVADSNQPLPRPRYADCPHVRAPKEKPAKAAPMRPTVGAVLGDEASIVSFDRALSLREQYVADLMEKAAVDEREGRPLEAAMKLNVAMRADRMTDDAWLVERKARAAYRR